MPQTAVDEFDEAAETLDGLSVYDSLRSADVEDQREYRQIPKGTACVLGIQGFSLVQPKAGSKGKPAILVKVEVNEPEEYADGSSNFSVRYSLNATVAPGKESSGLDMTVKHLSWIFAAVNQVSSAEGKAAMILEVLNDFPNLSQNPEDVPAFHEALVANANEKLKGTTFRTKAIGIDIGQDTGKTDDEGNAIKYRDKQSFGTIDYPKPERAKK